MHINLTLYLDQFHGDMNKIFEPYQHEKKTRKQILNSKNQDMFHIFKRKKNSNL